MIPEISSGSNFSMVAIMMGVKGINFRGVYVGGNLNDSVDDVFVGSKGASSVALLRG